MRFAAIDIGSNAVRMLFEEVHETETGPVFKKLSLIRLPVRLGEDAFLDGTISQEKEEKLISMAKAFQHLSSIFDIQGYRATATSAMRDSKNGPEIIQHIKDEVGVEINIIPGEEEAEILFNSIFNTGKLNQESSYMFIDVGGGSTEINFYNQGERVAWKSFNLGTVRLKEDIVKEKEWEKFKHWITKKSEKYNPEYAVGTGGNINSLYKRCGLKNWEMLSRSLLKAKIDELSSYNMHELVSKFKFKPDRADVVVHGGTIYHKAMKYAQTKEMIVPKVGLPDGLIRQMYLQAIKNESTSL